MKTELDLLFIKLTLGDYHKNKSLIANFPEQLIRNINKRTWLISQMKLLCPQHPEPKDLMKIIDEEVLKYYTKDDQSN